MTTEKRAKEVYNEKFVVTDLPKFKRAVAPHRESEIERDLAEVKGEQPEGTTVCIRQYAIRESAHGTLYNLRKRHGKPDTEEWDGWSFALGPLDEFGQPGLTGLFATYTTPNEAF